MTSTSEGIATTLILDRLPKVGSAFQRSLLRVDVFSNRNSGIVGRLEKTTSNECSRRPDETGPSASLIASPPTITPANAD